MARKKKVQKPATETKVDSPYYSRSEAANYLRVAPWFVAQAIREGKLAHIPLGKRYVVRRDDLDALAESLRKTA